jgi:hypothetical protein
MEITDLDTKMAADLYVATRSDRSDIVKVGRSVDVRKRCCALSASQCFRVHAVYVYPQCGDCERDVHERLKPYRVSGGSGREWFNIPASEAVRIIDAMLPGRREARGGVGSEETPWEPTRIVYHRRTGRYRLRYVYCR